MDRDQIRTEVHRLFKERNDKSRELMREYDTTVYYPQRKKLYEECGKLGHKMVFTHFGPLGHPWYRCTYCDWRECKKED